MNTRISVITPTYNRAYVLQRAIDSVIAQTHQDWEMIIVDDGSTDTTKELVKNYADPRIKYIFQGNAGPSAARNNGMKMATGEWVCYLDSDDEFLPQYMETMLKHFEKDPTKVFGWSQYTRNMVLLRDGEIVDSYFDNVNVASDLTVEDIFLRKYYFTTDGLMHSRIVIEDGIEWDTQLRVSEDWDFFMQIGEKYPIGFLYARIPLFVYYRTIGGDSLSSAVEYKQMADAFEHIYQKHKNDKLLVGQTWYPERVEKYMRYFAESPNGKLEERHWKDGVVQHKKRVGEQ